MESLATAICFNTKKLEHLAGAHARVKYSGKFPARANRPPPLPGTDSATPPVRPFPRNQNPNNLDSVIVNPYIIIQLIYCI